MVKRLGLLAALVAAAASSMLPAHASGSFFTASGTILVGNPATRTVGGATEVSNPCGQPDPDLGSTQGTDGYWIQLPAGAGGHAATLTANAPNDVDAWFYDENCTLIHPGDGSVAATDPNAYSMTSTDPTPNGDEAGTIPTFAAWVAVDLYAGANATFTFDVQ